MSILYIFDFDGTLHDSFPTYSQAVHKVWEQMKRDGVSPIISEDMLKDKTIRGWLGKSIPDMWQEFAPQIKDTKKKYYSACIGEEMHILCREGKSHLYDGVYKKLEHLKEKGVTMVILSNGTKKDSQFYWELFKLGKYFTRWYSGEAFGWAKKSLIIKQIARDFPADSYVVIGDRSSDYEAAISLYEYANNQTKDFEQKKVTFLKCLYGYGGEDTFITYKKNGFSMDTFYL